MKYLNFPNLLTFIRLIISPLTLPILLVYLLPYNMGWLNLILAALFVLFSLTDVFDGYLARAWNQETKLGKLLGPIADKFLSASVLIALVAAHKIFFYWAVILIGRALFSMGLCILSLEHSIPVPVTFWGKINTVVQVTYIAVAIFNPYQHLHFSSKLTILEWGLLSTAILLSIISVKKYLHGFITQFMMRQKPEQEV